MYISGMGNLPGRKGGGTLKGVTSSRNPGSKRGKLVSGRKLRNQLLEYRIGHFLVDDWQRSLFNILPVGPPGFFGAVMCPF